MPVIVKAATWIEPGDERTRHHLQNLVDSGASKNLITSWPMMWSNVNQELQKIDPIKLTKNALWSYQYLKHELKRAQAPIHSEQTAFLSNSAPAIRDFSSDSRFEQEANISINGTGNNTAFRINASYIKNTGGADRAILDGSHISFLYKNWVLGVGKIDRWWGPGWESSLILSNNARPTPSLFIQRNSASPFETPWLSWLGPWQMTTFMSQLEEDRYTPHTRIWGMRINLRPLKSLEIGLSRTAMWGGENRPNDGKTFFNLLVGHDNQGTSSREGANTNDEPGNQLAGVDLRWGGHLGQYTTAMYGQLIGEDEAGGLPSRHIGLAGIEFSGLLFDTQARINLEAENTTVYFYDSDKLAPDVAYEHPLYQSGYRYKGQPIGSSTDNDSESISLRSQLFFRNGHSANVAISKYNINMDGKDTSYPLGGNIYGSEHTKTIRTQLSYSVPVNKRLMVKAGAFVFSEQITLDQQTISNGVFVQLNTRW